MATLANRPERRRVRICMYGRFGTAKTVNSHKMPRTRTLDFDDGMQSVLWAIKEGIINKRPQDVVYETILEPITNRTQYGLTTEATVLDRATDQVDQWLAEEDLDDVAWEQLQAERLEADPEYSPYERYWDTLILDSGSYLSEACIDKGLQENAQLGLSKSKDRSNSIRVMRRQDWGAGGGLFLSGIQMWRALDKNLVLICHEYEETEEDDKGNSHTTGIRPLLLGQNREKVPNLFDEVWYCSVRGTKDKPQYYFQTSPDPLRACRTRFGCLDPMESADLYAIRTKIANYYGWEEDTLWTDDKSW